MARRRHCGPIQAARRKVKYAEQFAKTAANKKRKQEKHLRLLEKKARKGLFNLPIYMRMFIVYNNKC